MMSEKKSIELIMLFLTYIVIGNINGEFIANAHEVDGGLIYHHHIHNFFFNESDPNKSNYMVMHNHAIAMNYDATTHYLAKKLPRNANGLKRIFLHNAYYIPATFDFSKGKVKYNVSYKDSYNKSTLNVDDVVWQDYSIQQIDIDLLKVYGCAKNKDYLNTAVNSSVEFVDHAFQQNAQYKRIIVNWQSKYVVDSLAEKTIRSLMGSDYDYLFIDDLPRDAKSCINSNAGGMGSYASWKDGQLAFLQKVVSGLKNIKGRQGNAIRIFGNVWSPYADAVTAEWYASNKLRLDHYYDESGGDAREDLINGVGANSIDPETGLPAFKPLWGGGYLPANLVSVSPSLKAFYEVVKTADEKSINNYLAHHFNDSGVALSQGSWFGWYGETSVDKKDAHDNLVHTNAMQLLRAIPNWENLFETPLKLRSFDKSTQTYNSPLMRFSANAIQAVNPINKEIYAVFNTPKGSVNLLGKKMVSAYFVDEVFNVTHEDATSCLQNNNGELSLICLKKLGHGIRISVN